MQVVLSNSAQTLAFCYTVPMKYTRIKLHGNYHEIGPQVVGLSGASRKHDVRLDYLLETMHWIMRNKKCTTVLIERGPQFSASAFGALESIRGCLVRLRQAGKQVIYYAPEYSAADCYLSSACNQRIMHPVGMLAFRGFAASSVFFQRLMKKQGIDAEIIRRGRYKGAADPFRTSEFDSYSREQLQQLMDELILQWRESLQTQDGLAAETIDKLLGGAVFTAEQAQQTGFIHRTAVLDDICEEFADRKVKPAQPKKMRGHFGRGATIAVLVFEGGIVDGSSRNDPMLGQMIGDAAFVKEIHALRKNKKIKAVVLRINSGGGSAIASDTIVHELERLNEAKPLIVSMGPVAGSGGYWIATAGRKVFAQQSTITGSIGVVALFFQLQKLLHKYGIDADVVKHGQSADMGSMLRPMSEDERSEMDRLIEHMYQQFLHRVAAFRGLTVEQVHALGEGRLWIGSAAKTHALIDDVGDVHDAVAHAAELIGAQKYRLSFGPQIKQPWLMRMLAERGAESRATADLTSAAAPLRAAESAAALHGRRLLWDPVLSLVPYILATHR